MYYKYDTAKKKSVKEMEEMTKEEIIKYIAHRNTVLEILRKRYCKISTENIFLRRKVNMLDNKLKMMCNNGHRTFASYRSYRRNKNVKERKD